MIRPTKCVHTGCSNMSNSFSALLSILNVKLKNSLRSILMLVLLLNCISHDLIKSEVFCGTTIGRFP